jgi:hypothetical protein
MRDAGTMSILENNYCLIFIILQGCSCGGFELMLAT